MISLGELVSGVELRPPITYHTSVPLVFDMNLCKRSFQLLALALLMASFASGQVSIHSCQFDRWYDRDGSSWGPLLRHVD